MRCLLELFFVFFKIGLFTFGGGYAMLPIIQRAVVENKSWMTDDEFLDAISLTNSLPGPLATNCATFVGYRIRRVPGAVAAILGAAAPSVIVILLVAIVFHDLMAYPVVGYIFDGVRPAVVALILYAVIKLGKSAKLTAHLNWVVALFGFLAVSVLGWHPIVVVVLAATYGLLLRDRVVRAIDAAKCAHQEGEK